MEVIRHHYVNDKRKGDKWMNMDEGMSLTYKPLYVQVKDRLLEMIERKELRFGEKLPSEPDLAKMFGVSRSTVREAIRVLSQEGAVIVRHGLGYVCCRKSVLCKKRPQHAKKHHMGNKAARMDSGNNKR